MKTRLQMGSRKKNEIHEIHGVFCCAKVLWQLVSGRRSFLPRLSGALFGIAPLGEDPARLVITQRDNTLRTVNLATFKARLPPLLRPRQN